MLTQAVLESVASSPHDVICRLVILFWTPVALNLRSEAGRKAMNLPKDVNAPGLNSARSCLKVDLHDSGKPQRVLFLHVFQDSGPEVRQTPVLDINEDTARIGASCKNASHVSGA